MTESGSNYHHNHHHHYHHTDSRHHSTRQASTDVLDEFIRNLKDTAASELQQQQQQQLKQQKQETTPLVSDGLQATTPKTTSSLADAFDLNYNKSKRLKEEGDGKELKGNDNQLTSSSLTNVGDIEMASGDKPGVKKYLNSFSNKISRIFLMIFQYKP